jgi:hypothetical protein
MIYEYFKNGFIGHPKPIDRYFYYGQWEREKFEENCKKIKNWRYKDLEITYDYNSNGHRCKEIHELSDNYILVTGCSTTDGHEEKLEETYPYILANNLGMDYYNLGLKGSSANTTYYNLTMFLNKVHVKPKVIVIQWPHFNRFALIHKGGQYAVYNPMTNFHYDYDYEVFKTLHIHELPISHSYFYRKLTLEYLSNMNIKVIELNIMADIKLDNDGYNTSILQWNGIENFDDVARDLIHAGPATNTLWANKLLETIDSQKYKKKFSAI